MFYSGSIYLLFHISLTYVLYWYMFVLCIVNFGNYNLLFFQIFTCGGLESDIFVRFGLEILYILAVFICIHIKLYIYINVYIYIYIYTYICYTEIYSWLNKVALIARPMEQKHFHFPNNNVLNILTIIVHRIDLSKVESVSRLAQQTICGACARSITKYS